MIKSLCEFDILPSDTVIWRYLDFAKFCDLITRGAMFFCRLDRLGDPWEGHWPAAVLFGSDTQDVTGQGLQRARLGSNPAWERHLGIPHERKRWAVSCWHINSEESEALWKVYAGESRGIAIRSTISRLKNALAQQQKRDVYVDKVQYIDHGAGLSGMPPELNLPLIKRNSFAYERELRATIYSKPLMLKGRVPDYSAAPFEIEGGEYIPVSLESLTGAVYLSPRSESWYVQTVDSVARRYGFEFNIVKSTLLDPPAYLSAEDA